MWDRVGHSLLIIGTMQFWHNYSGIKLFFNMWWKLCVLQILDPARFHHVSPWFYSGTSSSKMPLICIGNGSCWSISPFPSPKKHIPHRMSRLHRGHCGNRALWCGPPWCRVLQPLLSAGVGWWIFDRLARLLRETLGLQDRGETAHIWPAFQSGWGWGWL